MSEGKKPAIVVKNLTKTFKIPLDKGQGVKSKILGRSKKGYREFTPLNDISFTVYEGDFFGIVGRNGSGKSTLLKTIAGIYEPTRGKVDVNGTIAPFIELGVGFNPQLTGKDNVYLNAAMLGFSREETDDMYDDIVDFAELHDFMEERLQNYSSGMQVRLAFSVAIRAQANVLLLDEVLAVGDAAFQQKCFDYFDQLRSNRKTVILVTHNMSHVERFCNRGLLLDKGEVSYIGSNEEVASRYEEVFVMDSPSEGAMLGSREGGADTVVEVASCALLRSTGETSQVVRFKEPFSIEFDVMLKDKSFSDFNFSFEIHNENDLLMVSESYTSLEFLYANFIEEKMKVRFSVDNILTNGRYFLTLKVMARNKRGVRGNVFTGRKIMDFSVVGGKYNTHSLTHPRVEALVEGANFTPYKAS